MTPLDVLVPRMFPEIEGEGRDGSEQAGKRRGFGRIEKRPSGRYRAAYTGPDGQLYWAPMTFDAKERRGRLALSTAG